MGISTPLKAELPQTWDQVTAQLKTKLSQPSFETWISPLNLSNVNGTEVTLLAESQFNGDWVKQHYHTQLTEAFKAVLGESSVSLNITVNDTPKTPSPSTFTDEPFENKRAWTPRTTKCNLNPNYTFENFVVGSANRFCHAAALAVAETPAQSYNPFFIYGGVGLGKTHLTQAIGHFILKHNPDLRVKYVTAETFTNDLISSIYKKDMKPFRDRYRKIDVLIIDDVQFLESKERTQEEIFHTFNTLHELGKQIILSSDRPPKNLSGLEDRLRSRFEWGLIADIQPPDVETRIAILKRKLEQRNLPEDTVPFDVLNVIAEMHPNNVRELEGALNKVVAYAMLTQTPIDLEMVKSVLGLKTSPDQLCMNDILETVARYFHLESGDLKSMSRAKEISHARQVGVYVLRTMTEASFPKIGEFLGGRKHTTVLYAFDKVSNELEHNTILAQQIKEIMNQIKCGR